MARVIESFDSVVEQARGGGLEWTASNMTIAHGGSGSTSTAYSPLKSFANIFISFVGAGVLGLPYAFRMAGVVEGTIIMIVVAWVSVKAMLMLVDCKYHILATGVDANGVMLGLTKEGKTDAIEMEELLINNPSPPRRDANSRDHSDSNEPSSRDLIRKSTELNPDTMDYGDVGRAALGNPGFWVVQIAIVVSQIGICCAYLIFITHNVGNILGVSANEILFAALFPVAFLANIRDLSGLAMFSLIANTTTIFAYFVVFFFDFSKVEEAGLHGSAINLEGVPFFLGVAVYCYEGAGMIIALENSFPPAHRKKFPQIFRTALLLITTIYISFGVSGYVSFGSDTNRMITLNLPAGIVPNIIKSCLSFSLLFTYPVMMFPVSALIEKFMAMKMSSGDAPLTELTHATRITVRCTLVLISASVVVVIPDFAAIMGLIGSTCCMPLALILPGIIHLKVFKSKNSVVDVIMNYLIVGLGVTGSILGTLDALDRILGNGPNEDE